MKTTCLIFVTCLLISLHSIGQSCNNWLELPNFGSFVKVGDLDITGDKVTIEATFVRTAPWNGSDLFQGDLVSKHEDPKDCNYLLRPSSAEITTTNGYFKTPVICPIELNKNYHAALVYDGSTLKFYRNGFLMSQVPATGNLIQNDWQTQIGLYFNQVTQEQFVGYIQQVRIWNIARTQNEIKAYMNQSLPNPQTTPGLLAYYVFGDLINKQGNAAWNGSVAGSAAIDKTNPNCAFVADSCNILSNPVQVSFTAPDTVCVNSPVTITNTSTGASSYYWNFCVASIDAVPTAANIGNPGGLSMPVFIDYALYNGNYYGFLVNYNPGRLIRLDFGNSLLNNPVSVDLGNFSGIIPTGAEAIQIVQNEGRWYAIIVGGSPAAGSSPRILKVDFGSNLANTSPAATNWGNLGNMLQPIDLHVFKEGSNWYGFTVNSENNTITRFNFTNSFNNTPTAVNLGNIGNLQYPTGIYAINDNGFWRVFVVNGGDNTRTSNACSLTRLDFGPSLLNTPTGINLGNPGNMLQHPRDFTIMKLCDQIIGFAVNGNPNYNDLVKINFNNNLSVPPVLSSLGNNGNFNFPHSISKLFRVNNDVYGFITNVANNTISRLKFNGCSSSSLPNSTLQDPPTVIYNAPGVYNINLTVDDGLPTQAAYCKQIVVVAPPNHVPTKNISICEGDSIKVGTSPGLNKYTWNTNASKDSIFISNPGTYWVETGRIGCTNRDSFVLSLNNKPIISLPNDTSVCEGAKVMLSTYFSPNYSYNWLPATGLSNVSNNTAEASPIVTTIYQLKVTDGICTHLDSITVFVNSTFFEKPLDKEVCEGDSVQLISHNNAEHVWSPSSSLTNATTSSPYAFPQNTTNYQLSISDAACNSDTVFTVVVKVNSKPLVSAHKTNDITCAVPFSQLSAAGAETYSWSPATGLDNPSGSNPVAFIDTTTIFTVTGENEFGCWNADTISVKVNFVGKMLALLPNAFTPNGDGRNDCFGIRKWGAVSNLEFSIFNRWGERVFFTNNPMQCWDGTYKGQWQPNDVFVYIVKANSVCGKIFVKGTVTLIR